MVTDPSGPFIDVNRLDMKKYGRDQALSKVFICFDLATFLHLVRFYATIYYTMSIILEKH